MKLPTHSVLKTIAAVMVASLIASCATTPSTDSDVAGSTQEGGTLRVGILGAASDTLDVAQATTPLAYTVAFNVFDSVAQLDGNEISYTLAESVTANADATEWTIVLHDGINFHDGSELTADDVRYSLEYLSDSPSYASLWSGVDWQNSTSDGDRTVVVAFSAPKAAFVEEALARMSVVFPAGYTLADFAAPVGSGPFKVQSYDPNSGAVLVRNDDYWAEPAILDEIQLMPIADSDAKTAALNSGQIDFASGITATSAESLSTDSNFKILSGGVENSNAFSFSMNTTMAPFDDPEVRAALRVLVDRQQLVDVVFRGQGEIGNDIIGKGLPGYNNDIPQRELDVEAATAVLAEKGVTELNILASETTPGILDATQLLKQQLAAAGVTLNIEEVDPTAVYSDMERIYTTQMFASYAVNVPVASMAMIMTGADSTFNYSRWADPEYNALLRESLAIVDPEQRQNNLDAIQQTLWDEGADIVWGFQPSLSASVENLSGVSIRNTPLFATAEFKE